MRSKSCLDLPALRQVDFRLDQQMEIEIDFGFGCHRSALDAVTTLL